MQGQESLSAVREGKSQRETGTEKLQLRSLPDETAGEQSGLPTGPWLE